MMASPILFLPSGCSCYGKLIPTFQISLCSSLPTAQDTSSNCADWEAFQQYDLWLQSCLDVSAAAEVVLIIRDRQKMGRKLHIVNQSHGKYAQKWSSKNKAKTPLPEDSYFFPPSVLSSKNWTEEARSESCHSEGTACGSWLQERVDPDMDWKIMQAGQLTGSALKRKHNSYLGKQLYALLSFSTKEI